MTPAFEALSETDARKLLAERGAAEMLAQSEGYALRGVWIARGPMKIDGDLTFDARTYGGNLIIFDGDVEVAGCWKDTDNMTTFIGVLGNLHARDVITSDFVFVTGDVVVSGTLYGESGSNKNMFVDGVLRAGTMIDDGHGFEVEEATADVGINTMLKAKHLDPPYTYGADTMTEILLPELIDADENIDKDALRAALVAGKKVTR